MLKTITQTIICTILILQAPLASSCPFPSAATVYDMIHHFEKKVHTLNQRKATLIGQITTLAPRLQIEKSRAQTLATDASNYAKLVEANQAAINQAYYISELLKEVSVECSECLTLEELFDYVQVELPEEYWPILSPLKSYLEALDEKAGAEKQRLTQALKTFSSDILVEELETELISLIEIEEAKRTAYEKASANATNLQASYDSANQNLRSVTRQLEEASAELVIWQGSTGQTRESQCSADGTIVK